MIHSVPHFAEPVSSSDAEYSYPSSGRENGQTAMCISFRTKDELDKILTQLLCMRPNVYDMVTEDDVLKISSKLMDLEQRKWPKKVAESTGHISSIGGQSFTSFARNAKSSHKDLYLELIAPALESDLLVETWRRGAGDPLPSNCSFKYKVNNVESLELKFQSSGPTRETSPWNYREDHSKWAVAVDKPAACVGDINRMSSQYKRGGGSMCMKDRQVWQIMKNSIHGIEACPKPVRSGKAPAGRSNGDSSSSGDGLKKKNKSPTRYHSYLLVLASILLANNII